MIRLRTKARAALVRSVDSAEREPVECAANESEVARDRREGRRQTRADSGHGANDNHRDKRRDQAVLDRRSATLVPDEASECRHLNCSEGDFGPCHSPANARTRR